MDSSEKRPRGKAIWVAGTVAGLALAGGGGAAVAAVNSGHTDAGRQRAMTAGRVIEASPSCSAGATTSKLATPVPSPTAATAAPVVSPTAVPTPSPKPTASTVTPVASPTAVPTPSPKPSEPAVKC